MQLDIRIDSRVALAKLERIPEFVSKEIRSRFRTLGQQLRNELRASMPRHSGRASRAIFSSFDRRREQNDIALLVGGKVSKAPYLPILERGGLIRPKQAKALAIPVGNMRDRRRSVQAKDVKASPQSFGYVRTFIREDVILGERASGEIEPIFLLKPSHLFPRESAPKPIRTFRDRNEARIKREVEQAVIAGVEKAQRPGSGGGGD